MVTFQASSRSRSYYADRVQRDLGWYLSLDGGLIHSKNHISLPDTLIHTGPPHQQQFLAMKRSGSIFTLWGSQSGPETVWWAYQQRCCLCLGCEQKKELVGFDPQTLIWWPGPLFIPGRLIRAVLHVDVSEIKC